MLSNIPTVLSQGLVQTPPASSFIPCLHFPEGVWGPMPLNCRWQVDLSAYRCMVKSNGMFYHFQHSWVLRGLACTSPTFNYFWSTLARGQHQMLLWAVGLAESSRTESQRRFHLNGLGGSFGRAVLIYIYIYLYIYIYINIYIYICIVYDHMIYPNKSYINMIHHTLYILHKYMHVYIYIYCIVFVQWYSWYLHKICWFARLFLPWHVHRYFWYYIQKDLYF